MPFFVADIALLDADSMEFMDLIPNQRFVVNGLLADGVIHAYAVSADRTHLWCVLEVSHLQQAIEVVRKFPLSDFMKYQVRPLLFYQSGQSVLGSISLN